MAKTDTKALLDDVRGYDAVLLNVLLVTDRQAMALFRIYVTLALAVLSILATGIFNTHVRVEPMIALGVASILLITGCYFCMTAMATASIGLPGRRAEFWEWSLRGDVDEDLLMKSYLTQAKEVQDINHVINRKGSTALKWAKRSGIAAFALGATAGAIAAVIPIVLPCLRPL